MSLVHRRNRAANYAVIIAIVLTVLLSFAALAVDISYMRLAALQAQNAADAGAHAALVAYRRTSDEDEARDVAMEVLSQNVIVGTSVTIDENADITFGGWDYELGEFDANAAFTNAVKVDVARDSSMDDGPINLLVAPIIGYDTTDVAASATGAVRSRDVMLVLDTTRSFKDEIADAKSALLAFLDYMYNEGETAPMDRIGLATFVGSGELHTELTYIDSNYSDIYDTWDDEVDYCEDLVWDMHYAAEMPDCCAPTTCTVWPPPYWWTAGTNQSGGLEVASEHLIDNGNPYALKTIVLISDGQPCCWAPGVIPSCDATRTNAGYIEADYAYANDISIFSVSFNYPHNATQSAYMDDLTRGYGAFYETPDQEELPGILAAIAAEIPIALVEVD
jgi:Flp pilus assembly protein TadG